MTFEYLDGPSGRTMYVTIHPPAVSDPTEPEESLVWTGSGVAAATDAGFISGGVLLPEAGTTGDYGPADEPGELPAGGYVAAYRERLGAAFDTSDPWIVAEAFTTGGPAAPTGTEAPTWDFVTAGDFQLIDGRERVLWESQQADRTYAPAVVLDAFREPMTRQKAADKIERIDLTLHADAYKYESPRDFVTVRPGDRITDHTGGVYRVETAVLEGCDDQYQLRCKRTGTA